MCDGYSATLRPVSANEIDMLVRWDTDPELAYLMGYGEREPEESRARLMKLLSDRNSVVMCIAGSGGNVVGDIVLTEIAWRSGDAELTVRIGERDYWGKGMGEQAVNQMLDIAFARLGLNRVYLRVCADNLRATRCYEKCGFKQVGAVRRRLDPRHGTRTVVLMTITRGSWQARSMAS